MKIYSENDQNTSNGSILFKKFNSERGNPKTNSSFQKQKQNVTILENNLEKSKLTILTPVRELNRSFQTLNNSLKAKSKPSSKRFFRTIRKQALSSS